MMRVLGSNSLQPRVGRLRFIRRLGDHVRWSHFMTHHSLDLLAPTPKGWRPVNPQDKVAGEAGFIQRGDCAYFNTRGAHPGKLTWNLKMDLWKTSFLHKPVVFRWHVDFPGSHFKGPLARLAPDADPCRTLQLAAWMVLWQEEVVLRPQASAWVK